VSCALRERGAHLEIQQVQDGGAPKVFLLHLVDHLVQGRKQHLRHVTTRSAQDQVNKLLREDTGCTQVGMDLYIVSVET
jgi:hypothetical protein